MDTFVRISGLRMVAAAVTMLLSCSQWAWAQIDPRTAPKGQLVPWKNAPVGVPFHSLNSVVEVAALNAGGGVEWFGSGTIVHKCVTLENGNRVGWLGVLTADHVLCGHPVADFRVRFGDHAAMGSFGGAANQIFLAPEPVANGGLNVPVDLGVLVVKYGAVDGFFDQIVPMAMWARTEADILANTSSRRMTQVAYGNTGEFVAAQGGNLAGIKREWRNSTKGFHNQHVHQFADHVRPLPGQGPGPCGRVYMFRAVGFQLDMPAAPNAMPPHPFLVAEGTSFPGDSGSPYLFRRLLTENVNMFSRPGAGSDWNPAGGAGPMPLFVQDIFAVHSYGTAVEVGQVREYGEASGGVLLTQDHIDWIRAKCKVCAENCPGETIPSAPSSTSGTTVGAEASGTSSCIATATLDVFHNFTPAVTGVYTVDTCGSQFDTVLSVYTDCPAMSMIACNDDACGQQSSLDVLLDAGTTYYIRVAGYNNSSGAYVLNISAPPEWVGVCCIDQVCFVRTESECLGAGGEFVGPYTTCEAFSLGYSHSENNDLPIPDNQCQFGGVTSTYEVSENFTVGKVVVRVIIPNHTWIGDLRIRLVRGDTSVMLWNRQCGSHDGIDVLFSDTGSELVCNSPTAGGYLPSGPGAGRLSSLIGQPSAGAWTLEVCDAAAGDVGTLATWGLWLFEQSGSPCNEGICPADWNRNGWVEVADIFAFLHAWFGEEPEAINFGGVPGVVAIFAFLSVWFNHGIGPC